MKPTNHATRWTICGSVVLLIAALSAQAQSETPAPQPEAIAPVLPQGSSVPLITPSGPNKEMLAAAKNGRASEVARLNGELAALQADPSLSPRIPAQALADARAALVNADKAQGDAAKGPYLLYLADRKVQLVRTLAQTAYAQAQYQALVAQHGDPAAAYQAPTPVTPAIVDTPQQEELRKNAAALQPRRDRGGLRFTVDDVLVMPGTITLTREVSNGLIALSVYLRRNPQSQLLLIGHARGSDSDDAIVRTAQSRADGVRNYLMRLGVQVEQITLDTKVSQDPNECARCVDAFLDPPWANQTSP